QNYYAQDIEATVEKCDPALGFIGAAFSFEIENEERLVVLHELRRRQRRPDLEKLCARIRRTIAEEFQLQTHAVAILAPGKLPKTSSGKVRRGACRAAFNEGILQPLQISYLQEAQVPHLDSSL